MSRYLLIAAIPHILLWPIWRSWIFTPCTLSTLPTTTMTITTTVFDTFILTSTIPPTATITVTSWEEHRLAAERRARDNQEFNQKLAREKLAWQQEWQAIEMAELWERKMRNSWSVWFMDWCYYPLAYFLVACVASYMAADWDHVREIHAEMIRDWEEGERERLENQDRGS